MLPSRRFAPLVLGLLGVVLSATLTAAQIPEEFNNLQLLPQDINRRELINTMRGFASDLGVRCNFCHVGEDPDSLEGYDFASDEKEHKKIARVMIEMVREINGTHLPKTGKEAPRQVTCVTCHHGQKEPSTLEAELLESFEDGGADAFVARYRELRTELYGAGVYNFGEFALLGVASTLGRERQDLVAAGAAIDLNLEFFPDSFGTYAALGQLRQMTGDTAGAIEALEKALSLQPDNPQVKQMLERLKQ